MFIVLFALAGTAAGNPGPAAPRIIVIGDSLSAGYNLPPGAAFPDQLERWLEERGLVTEVINAAVSGDTTSGGLARIDWAIGANDGAEPQLAIVELGGNDALRGIEPALTRSNLAAIIERLQAREIPVLLTGMRAPPNMGREYETEFNSIFPQLAKKYDTYFYPFFLDGVATVPHLNLDDGIHPNQEGVSAIVENIGPSVLEALNGS